MYNWNPRDYHRHSQVQAEMAFEILDKQNFRGDERVLDIGCGDGKITAEIAGRVPSGYVLGVDQSPDMIAFAREHFAAQRANLDFETRPAQSLGEKTVTPEERFDFVFSNACLHWVEDQPSVLAGVRGLLRPGGRFYFQMGGRGNVAELRAAVEAVAARERWKAYFSNFSRPYFFHGPEEYNDWLAAAGFQAERVELIRKDNLQPGTDGVAAYLRTTWMPYTSHVPENERDEFILEAAREYTAEFPPDNNGITNIPMVRLEVVGHAA